jgi:hypothetical protein
MYFWYVDLTNNPNMAKRTTEAITDQKTVGDEDVSFSVVTQVECESFSNLQVGSGLAIGVSDIKVGCMPNDVVLVGTIEVTITF